MSCRTYTARNLDRERLRSSHPCQFNPRERQESHKSTIRRSATTLPPHRTLPQHKQPPLNHTQPPAPDSPNHDHGSPTNPATDQRPGSDRGGFTNPGRNPQTATRPTSLGAREENRTPDLRITSQSRCFVGTGMAWYQAVFEPLQTADTTSHRAIRRRMWTDCGLSGPVRGPP